MDQIIAYIDARIDYLSKDKQYWMECNLEYNSDTYKRKIGDCRLRIDELLFLKRFISGI